MRYVGRDGIVQVGANAIGQITEFEFTDERAVARAPVMGQGYIGHGIGAPAVTGTVRCLIDHSDATGQGALTDVTSVQLTFHPQGTGSGLPEFSLASAFINSIPRSFPSEEFTTVEFAFVADSALVESTQT